MKLKEWADKTGVKYLTAYRWFKAGTLPVEAYQTESGTIIVKDESMQPPTQPPNSSLQSNDVMSTVLRKTVELSKNNASIEDFAAWILSTFTLKFNNSLDAPKYSRVKPKPEEVQKHFQQFLKPKGDKPKPNMFVAPPEALEEIAEQEKWTLGDTSPASADVLLSVGVESSNIDTVTMTEPELKGTLDGLLSSGPEFTTVKLYGNVAEGVVNRSVDSTPQLNYTGSNSLASSNYFQASSTTLAAMPSPAGATVFNNAYYIGSEDARLGVAPVYPGGFKPTQKELESASKALGVTEKPRRGRKPSKNSRKA